MLETLVRHLDMVRLTVASLALLVMVGCTGLIDDGGSGDLTPEEVKARQLFAEKALPRINESCTVCHNGSRMGIGFVEGTSDGAMREALLAFTPTVVNITAPQSSRLLTKGLHEGPALTAQQASDILEWIQAERAAQPDPGDQGPRLETTAFIPQICVSGDPGTPTCPINSIPLDELGVAGAKIELVAQALGSGLYVKNLKLVPGPMGAFIEHPLFVSYPETAEPIPDNIDRFFSVKMNLKDPTVPVEEQLIGGGTAAFVGFPVGPNDKIAIHFKGINVWQDETMTGGGGGGGTGGGGCKDLASFKANAQAAFRDTQGGLAQACAGCHQGGNAQAAVNMNGIATTDDAMIQLACNQIKTRINFQDPDNSGIFLAVTPGNAGHPVAFDNTGNFDAFKNQVKAWIAIEVTQP